MSTIEKATDSLWAEVESMAQAISAGQEDESLGPESIQRWQNLFGYSAAEAATLIMAQRSDVSCQRISDEHWALIKDAEQAAGYDREACEHRHQLVHLFRGNGMVIPVTGDQKAMFGFRLGGLLGSAEKVKEIAGLEQVPMVKEGWSDREWIRFCLVEPETKKTLEAWLAQKAVLPQ